MILTGLARLGRDAEVRFTTAGEPVATLALAYSYGKKGDDGNRPAQWIDAALWGKRAETLAPYLQKGGLVSVVLSDSHIESYTDRSGDERHKLVARVLDIELAGGRKDEQKSGGNAQHTEQKPANNSQQPAQSGGYDDFDDQIPFVSLNAYIKNHLI